jgi:hypothetical protein
MKINSLKHLQLESKKKNCWTIIIINSYIKTFNPKSKKYIPIYDGLEIFLGKYINETEKRIELVLQSHSVKESIKFNLKSVNYIMFLKRKPTLNQLYSIKQYCNYNIVDLKIKLVL